MKHNMMKERRKPGKFKHYILAPFRILNKARQLYMRGVVECAGGYGYGGVGTLSPAIHHYIPPLPAETQSQNLHSSRTSGCDGEGQNGEAEPIRTAENNETRLVVHMQRRQQFVGYRYNNRNKMSYSTEVRRKIGRIEEDQPCCFEEDQIDVKTHLLYLYPRRRRTNVINNKSTGYYQ